MYEDSFSLHVTLLSVLEGPSLTVPLAMYTALRQLGYHPCHGTNMWEDPAKFLTLWTEAMRAKYLGEGERWGRRELDVVLGGFDVGGFVSLFLFFFLSFLLILRVHMYLFHCGLS